LTFISTVLIIAVMLMEVTEALLESGATVTSRNVRPAHSQLDGLIDVAMDDARSRFAVEIKQRAPYPNEISQLESARATLSESGTPLLIVPFVTKGLGEALMRAGWSWADRHGNFDLRAPGLRLRQRRASKPSTKTRSTLPQGSGSLAVVRTLIAFREDEDEEAGASALAAQAGVTQPRASQILARLADLGLVERTERRRWHPDRAALLDRFLAEYKGPGGSCSYGYSLDSPREVAVAISRHAARRRRAVSPPRLAVSTDVGPDLLAPWRTPTILVAYVKDAIDLSEIGVVPAQAQYDANVILRSPSDRSVWPTPALVADIGEVEIPLADPTQMLWDLADLGGDDRGEAASVLREWLLRSH
jgi:DNA-binding transcriptional ArsR family regulator